MSREQYYFLVQEMRQLMEELLNVADRTTFNGNKLLGEGLRPITAASFTSRAAPPSSAEVR
ncbi:MAG: hypothetical protein EBS54_06810 [Betaproteobacteria bacterium]|nr:hypothetical protein [Betaproteobacteria bacterium]